MVVGCTRELNVLYVEIQDPLGGLVIGIGGQGYLVRGIDHWLTRLFFIIEFPLRYVMASWWTEFSCHNSKYETFSILETAVSLLFNCTNWLTLSGGVWSISKLPTLYGNKQNYFVLNRGLNFVLYGLQGFMIVDPVPYGSRNMTDQHRDMRMDVDNMSYEVIMLVLIFHNLLHNCYQMHAL